MPSISLPPIWSLSGRRGSSSGLIGSFSLCAIAAKSVARPAASPGGKSGMWTSSRPWRFRSTSTRSGREVAKIQMILPRFFVSDISLASIP